MKMSVIITIVFLFDELAWDGLGWPGMAWDGLAWVSNCSYDTTGSHWGGSGGRLKTPPNTGLVGSEPNTGHYQVKYSI